jgi:hypothetical protein
MIQVTKFIEELSINTQSYVYFEVEKGQVIYFVVKLSSTFENKMYEILRYDSGHNYPHKDILNKDGHVIRKVWFRHLSNKEVLTKALFDIRNNFEKHIERFNKKWFR